jgi:hypothetical protein
LVKETYYIIKLKLLKPLREVKEIDATIKSTIETHTIGPNCSLDTAKNLVRKLHPKLVEGEHYTLTHSTIEEENPHIEDKETYIIYNPQNGNAQIVRGSQLREMLKNRIIREGNEIYKVEEKYVAAAQNGKIELEPTT